MTRCKCQGRNLNEDWCFACKLPQWAVQACRHWGLIIQFCSRKPQNTCFGVAIRAASETLCARYHYWRVVQGPVLERSSQMIDRHENKNHENENWTHKVGFNKRGSSVDVLKTQWEGLSENLSSQGSWFIPHNRLCITASVWIVKTC